MKQHARAYAQWTEGAQDNSYLKGIEVILRETIRQSYPEDVENPTVAPRYNAEQRSLDPTHRSILALSPVLVTFRELPLKDYRGRSVANSEARNEEAKKQKDSENKKVRFNTEGYGLAVTFLLAMRSST